MIDSEISPTTFSLAKFSSSTVALFLKLPLETVLRRGQVAVLNQPQYVRAVERAASPPGRPSSEDEATATSLDTIVQPGSYYGVFGTMYTIINDEGSRAVPTASSSTAVGKDRKVPKNGKPGVAETVYRRGQGVEGLWRGWKVNWWGLIGLWTAAVVGGGGDGEF
jgi:fusion and transport protein UGO1